MHVARTFANDGVPCSCTLWRELRIKAHDKDNEMHQKIATLVAVKLSSLSRVFSPGWTSCSRWSSAELRSAPVGSWLRRWSPVPTAARVAAGLLAARTHRLKFISTREVSATGPMLHAPSESVGTSEDYMACGAMLIQRLGYLVIIHLEAFNYLD